MNIKLIDFLQVYVNCGSFHATDLVDVLEKDVEVDSLKWLAKAYKVSDKRGSQGGRSPSPRSFCMSINPAPTRPDGLMRTLYYGSNDYSPDGLALSCLPARVSRETEGCLQVSVHFPVSQAFGESFELGNRIMRRAAYIGRSAVEVVLEKAAHAYNDREYRNTWETLRGVILDLFTPPKEFTSPHEDELVEALVFLNDIGVGASEARIEAFKRKRPALVN